MKSNVVILKSNFLIRPENVKPALNAVLRAYPILNSFPKPLDTTLQLQYVLHLLGYHTRIHQTGMLFGLSKVKNSIELVPEPDYAEFFKLLGIFTQPGSSLDLVIDGLEKNMILNSASDPIDSQTILAFLKEQEGTLFTTKEVKQMSTEVIEKIAADIKPEVIKAESKSMGDLVAEAIANADSELKREEDETVVDGDLQTAIDKIEQAKTPTPVRIRPPRTPKVPRKTKETKAKK